MYELPSRFTVAFHNGHEEVGQSDGGCLACKCRDKVPAMGEVVACQFLLAMVDLPLV